MQSQTKRTKMLTTLAMLSALAFLAMITIKIPVVLFLKYEPKDVIITIGGFLYGPLAAFSMSVVVSFVEMLTVSDTGFIGFVMNVVSSCAFACTAAFVYKKKHTMAGAVTGLASGCLLAAAIMVLWNYMLTPIFMGIPREAVVGMLLPAILPFNLLKGGLNAAITMIIYKPVKLALQKSSLMPLAETQGEIPRKINPGVIISSLFVISTCVLIILIFQGKL